jgi:molybdopterin/thiamine biosynthesis adenylyltransferase
MKNTTSPEQDRVRQILEQTFDPKAVCFRPVGPARATRAASVKGDPDHIGLKILPADLEHFGAQDSLIVVPDELLESHRDKRLPTPISFRCLDGDAVYSALNTQRGGAAVTGLICIAAEDRPVDIGAIASTEDLVCVIASPTPPSSASPALQESSWKAEGYIGTGGGWDKVPVVLVPVRPDVHSRNRGILETDVLSDSTIVVVGIGSGGAPIAMESVKAGVGHHILVDHDRLEVGNVARHLAGLSDVGRYKVDFMEQMIHEKNPGATVQKARLRIGWENREVARQLIRQANLVICGIDDHDGRLVINKLCVEENNPMIVAGVFRRAYGGQVLRVRPHLGPCYQCFLRAQPEQARDQEVSSAAQAQRLAYTDRPVAIEPGLSTDIAPISLLVVKLAIHLLLAGKSTTLGSLDQDLVAPHYLWLNRREARTQFEKLRPLGFGLNGLRILRWYGCELERDPGCPVCGDFVSAEAAAQGVSITG